MDAFLPSLIAGGAVALGVLALLMLLVALVLLADRVLLAMEARGWIYWRKTKTLSSIGAELVQEIDPGAQAVKRGMDQERVRKNVRPAEDPPFQVDLDRGTVRIRRAAGSQPASGEVDSNAYTVKSVNRTYPRRL